MPGVLSTTGSRRVGQSRNCHLVRTQLKSRARRLVSSVHEGLACSQQLICRTSSVVRALIGRRVGSGRAARALTRSSQSARDHAWEPADSGPDARVTNRKIRVAGPALATRVPSAMNDVSASSRRS